MSEKIAQGNHMGTWRLEVLVPSQLGHDCVENHGWKHGTLKRTQSPKFVCLTEAFDSLCGRFAIELVFRVPKGLPNLEAPVFFWVKRGRTNLL